MTTWSGTVPNLGLGAVLGNDLNEVELILKALTDSWSTYVVAWTSTGTAPAIGNGTLEGRYFRDGKLIGLHIRLIMGSSTTFGTGQYFLSLPVNARVSNVPLSCYMLDNGTANKAATAVVTSGLNNLFAVQGTTDWSATGPHTWANTDRIDICGMYEVA